MNAFRIFSLRELPEYLATLALDLHTEFYRFRPDQTLYDRKRRLQESLGENDIPNTFILRSNGEVRGSASIVKYCVPGRRDVTPCLASVYTVPEFRKRGVARMLINHVVAYARMLDVQYLYLFTDNLTDYYQRLGWVPVEPYVVAGVPVTIMRRRVE